MGLRNIIGITAILATPSGAMAWETFPCAALRGDAVRIFDGFGAATVLKAGARPIKLRKGAVLGEETLPLRTEWMTIDAPPSSAQPTLSPMAFSLYLVDSQKHFCTTMLRAEVFGANEGQNNYLVRCLVDIDRDGNYDHFHRYGELVSTNLRTGKSAPSKGVIQSDVPLPQTLNLVPLPNSAAISNSDFEPRVSLRLAVEAIANGEMILGLATGVGFSPQGLGIGRREATQRVTIPLRDGAQGEIGGWKIAVQQQGNGGWTATTISDPAAPPISFTCNGGVVVAGEAYTVMTAGSSQTLTLAETRSAAAER